MAGKGLKDRIERLEHRLILTALRETSGVKTVAAKQLGISERVIRYKMKKYGINGTTKLSGPDRFVDHNNPRQ